MELAEKLSRMEAALFDMDGTLLDSMPAWRGCNIEYLESVGIHPTDEQKLMIVCASSGTILFDYIRENFGIEVDVEKFRALQRARMEVAYAKGNLAKPGAREFIDKLRARGVKTVLATATWKSLTAIALENSGLSDAFDAICCCDVVGASKSNPEYFDRVSAMIGVPKDRCVLFEDAIYAIQTGLKAGLLGVVALTDPTNVIFRKEIAGMSDAMVDSLAELPL